MRRADSAASLKTCASKTGVTFFLPRDAGDRRTPSLMMLGMFMLAIRVTRILGGASFGQLALLLAFVDQLQKNSNMAMQVRAQKIVDCLLTVHGVTEQREHEFAVIAGENREGKKRGSEVFERRGVVSGFEFEILEELFVKPCNTRRRNSSLVLKW